MAVYRVYTGDDGQSHLEEISTPAPGHEFPHLRAKEVFFRCWPEDFARDWHNSNERLYVFTLSGQVEMGFGDGSKKVLGPGDVLLTEDHTGKGHTAHTIGGKPRVGMIISLA